MKHLHLLDASSFGTWDINTLKGCAASDFRAREVFLHPLFVKLRWTLILTETLKIHGTMMETRSNPSFPYYWDYWCAVNCGSGSMGIGGPGSHHCMADFPIRPMGHPTFHSQFGWSQAALSSTTGGSTTAKLALQSRSALPARDPGSKVGFFVSIVTLLVICRVHIRDLTVTMPFRA